MPDVVSDHDFSKAVTAECKWLEQIRLHSSSQSRNDLDLAVPHRVHQLLQIEITLNVHLQLLCTFNYFIRAGTPINRPAEQDLVTTAPAAR